MPLDDTTSVAVFDQELWERDGEELLRRRKETFFDCEPTPSISTVGDRLVELLAARQ